MTVATRASQFHTSDVTPHLTGSSSESRMNANRPSEEQDTSSSVTFDPNAAGPSTPSAHISTGDTLSEELPPAYTPSADAQVGEISMGFGPRRPFQPAPMAHRRADSRSATWQRPNPSGSSLGAYPGSLHRNAAGLSPAIPPPRHPMSVRRDTRSSSAPGVRPASDFARDFYAAGSNADAGLLGGTSSQYGYSVDPPQPPSSPIRQDAPSKPSISRPPEIQDDGRPTTVPAPGHPLLRDGKLLVYPAGYDCSKCHNTGYKNYDPSHPCSKCWSKHAKPYSGALTYTPWSSSAVPSMTGASVHLQRPLPSFSPPQASFRPHHRSTQSLSELLAAPSPSSFPSYVSSNGYPGVGAHSQSHVIPIPGGGVPMSPYLDTLQQPTTLPFLGVQMNKPPPGATVMRPGDPRIGGHLCWRCGGSGLVSFLIFDESTCGVCNGIGRTFS